MQQIPILNMDQIDQLVQMVKGIQQENRKDLDSILSESVNIQYSTIINLYNLTVEAWENKQKIIDNLCHFTLTMMNTVQYLWQKQYEQQDKISNAQIVIGTLQRNIGDLNEQNKQIKNRVSEAEIQLNHVANQKDRIEQLYRSASCIAFQSEKQLKQQEMGCKKCSACFQIKSQFDQQQSNIQQEKQSKILSQKQPQILSLKQENKKLEQEFSHLKQQHQLTRLEVQLAEIAIKDALTYKQSYISMVSQIKQGSQILPSQILSSNAPKAHLEQPSQFCPLNSHVLSNEIPANQQPQDLLGLQLDTRIHKQKESSQLSLIKLQKKQEKKTTYQTPFRKKPAKQCQSESEDDDQMFEESAIYNKKSVVIYQSNIDFTLSSNHQNSKQIATNQLNPESRLFCSTIGTQKYSANLSPQIHKRNKPQPNLRSKPYVPSDRQLNQSRDSQSSQNTINKLYNYISTKLISNRIRKH